MSGFIAIQRRFFEHPFWEEKRSFSRAEAWIDLIRMAAFSPHQRLVRGEILTINRGEVVASLRFLGERWGWKKDKVAAFVRLLENQTMVTRETRQGETVITLCKYDDYNQHQTFDSDTDQTQNPTENRHRPDTDPTNRIRVIREKREKNTPLPPEGEKAPTKKQENSPEIPKSLDTEEFLRAWELWQTHRKEIRKPLKPTSAKLQLAKLESIGPRRAIAAIRYSIEKGWQGIYEPENSNGSFAPLFPGQKIQKL